MAQTNADDAVGSLPRTIWILRFATALHKLQPQISGPVAMSIAMKEFEREHDRQPEKAAELLANPLGGPSR